MAKEYYDFLPDFVSNLDPEIYRSNHFLTLDLECDNEGDDNSPDPTWDNNDIVCASWVWADDKRGEEKYIHGGIHDMGPLIQDIYEADYVVAQNGKFDIKWLIRAGINPAKILLADTMLAEYTLTGNLKAGKKGALALGTLTAEYLGVTKEPLVDKMFKGKVHTREIPRRLLEKRVRSDIFQTRNLWLKQRERLFDEDVVHLFYTKCLLSPVLADIEFSGVHLDEERVRKEHDKYSRDAAAIEAEMNLMLGGRNPKSVPQMQEFLYDVLKFPVQKKAGIEWRPTGNDDIERLLAPNAKTQKQKKFIDLKKRYGKVTSALSKNLDYFLGVVTEREDNLFYAQFNQAQTVTHRLSSSGLKTHFEMYGKGFKSVQFQNFPRTFKPLMSSREDGWKLVEMDGAQIEFRVAGFIGQDVQICQDIVDGVDVHTFTASVLNACTEEEVREQKKTAPKGADWRTLAKSDTFKPLYGGEYGTDAQMAYYSAFREKYKGITKAQKQWEAKVLREKKITHPSGITFHYPNCRMSSSGYNRDFPSICNYPVQNLATGEIIPIALIAVWHILKAKEMRTMLVNTVHDSAIAESPDDELEELYEISKWAFLWWVYEYLDVVYDLQFNVPLGVGYQAGTHWSEGKEIYFEPSQYPAEMLDIDGAEITVSAVPPIKMEGVDYSNLMTGDD